jgi:hypothetical protein
MNSSACGSSDCSTSHHGQLVDTVIGLSFPGRRSSDAHPEDEADACHLACHRSCPISLSPMSGCCRFRRSCAVTQGLRHKGELHGGGHGRGRSEADRAEDSRIRPRCERSVRRARAGCLPRDVIVCRAEVPASRRARTRSPTRNRCD